MAWFLLLLLFCFVLFCVCAHGNISPDILIYIVSIVLDLDVQHDDYDICLCCDMITTAFS